MIRSLPLRSLATATAALAALSAPSLARAQATPLSESIVVGAWTFRPSVEVRVRGEYRRHPVDTGGNVYQSNAVLADGFGSSSPTVDNTLPGVGDQFYVSERSRLGLAVDRGPVTAALTLQDARVFGATQAVFTGPGEPLLPAFAPYEAYVDLHSRSGRHVFLRVGRQKVTWGDGRLVGANDWSLTGRSLDAARFGFQVGDFDVESMAVLLGAPGNLPPTVTGARQPATSGTGAQLYGLDVAWHIFPLLNVEAMGLARIVRAPQPQSLTPSDTVVIDGRVSGERRGVSYSVEGAYELGRVASYDVDRDLRAFALAARLGWETALPWHLTFGAEAAYASGDSGDPNDASRVQKRFDPILPDEHTQLSPMSLFAWSNVLTAGGSIKAKPMDELELMAGYRYAGLAEKTGRWTTGALQPVGASPSNTSSSLGHEIDYAMKIMPWRPIDIEAGYGLFVFGDGARAILREAGRPAKLDHWMYLSATVRAP
jgi:Alginate export